MVKFYSKKNDQVKEKPFSMSDSSDKSENGVYNSSSNGVLTPNFRMGQNDAESPSCKKGETNDSLTVWEDDYPPSISLKLSPSFFKVDYNNSLLSDGEKSDIKYSSGKAFINRGNKELGQKVLSEEDLRLLSLSVDGEKSAIDSPGGRVRRASLREHSHATRTSHTGASALSKTIREEFSSCGNIMSDLKEAPDDFRSSLVDHSSVVKPSPFLIEYLASKSKFSTNDQSSILRKALGDRDPDAIPPHSFSYADIHGEVEKKSETVNSFSSVSLPTNGSPSIVVTPKRPREPSKRVKNSSEKSGMKVNPCHSRSHSDGGRTVVTVSPLNGVSLSFSEKSSFPPQMSNKGSVKKSFMEDGGQSITPEADGFFPHPQPGQNLLDFLTSAEFSKTSAQLDRENAHFSIAEAVLAAIEQMNYETCHKNERKLNPSIQDESEDDVLSQKKLPSNRRKLRVRSRVSFNAGSSDEDPVTTDHSICDSPEPQSSDTSDVEPSSSEIQNEVAEGNSDEQSSCTTDPSSAENVAIAILMHYNSRLLPKASELQWLVSEQEAPQKLLPMPNSVAVSPDDVEGETFQPLLRGTPDWAPPRPQLILTLHKNTKRKARLIAQKWRCAGCGLLVSEKLSGHFRLCHYLGRFFCTSCHSNKKAIVPAKVLHKWDFKKYAVCNFSFELLSRMSADPLFHLGTLNPRLYNHSRDLHQTLLYRFQLFHARVYIFTCSRATKEKTLLERVPLHWSTEPHVYSLDDLLSVKRGQILQQTKQLTTTCINHISNCQICLGQGFICEICRERNPIFPFQLDAVTQCTKCRECFHFLCFSPNRSCPRCERRERRESKKEPSSG